MTTTQTPFQRDLNVPMNINGVESSRGYYNLTVSIFAVKLFCKGMKPNRHWKLKQVKDYFGIKGSKESILNQLQEMKKELE
jgi:hypothetical protein